MGRGEALRLLQAAFASAGLQEPAADGRILLEEATGSRLPGAAGSDGPLGSDVAGRLNAWARRRLAREPVFRILGCREFWGLPLRVTPDVLDPRPDTETVVTAALGSLGHRRNEPLRVLDLGTGSGALLCALLSECRQARGVGLDRSAAACAVAGANLEACGLSRRATIVEGDWSEPFAQDFDCIVSNPPYIPTAAIATLDPEVRDHDPRMSLDGGPDGLTAYRAICSVLPRLLAPGGTVVMEIGVGQAADVRSLIAASGLHPRETARDLGGRERAVVAGFPPGGAA